MEEDLEDIKELSALLSQRESAQEEIVTSSDEEDDYLELFEERNFDSESSILKTEQVRTDLDDYNVLQTYLTLEEQNEIDTCPNMEVQKVMILNRQKLLKLKRSLLQFSDLLQNCMYSLDKYENPMKKVDIQFFNAKCLNMGYPYFKDAKFVPAPPHCELIKKTERKEISPFYFDFNIYWTLSDQQVLINSVLKYYSEYLDTTDESSIMIDDGNNLNWQIISVKLAKRHNPESCKVFWKIHLHPSINKAPFDDNENKTLQKLVKKYNYENWDLIAKELNTFRSPYLVCNHYFRKLHVEYLTQRFSKQEDLKILSLVEKHRIGDYIPWIKISQEFKDRQKKQIYHRYVSHIRFDNIKKGTFSQAEDVLLYCLINKFGNNYELFQEYLPDRTYDQIKNRVDCYLTNININIGSWTVKEDKIILEHAREHGEQSLHLLENKIPRAKLNIIRRYRTLKKWTIDNPDKPIESFKRRQHVHLQQKAREKYLMRNIAKHFKNRIPTIAEIENIIEDNAVDRKLGRGGDDILDLQIIDYFKTSHATTSYETLNKPVQMKQSENMTALLRLCKMFNVNLDIPKNREELDAIPNLDDFDKDFLLKYRSELKNYDSVSTVNINKAKNCLVPPSWQSISALRSLLIQYKSYQDNASEQSNATKDNCKDLFQMEDFKTFYKRFYQIFKWPCIMSLHQPDSGSTSNSSNTSSKPKTYGARALKKLRLEKVKKMAEMKANKKNLPATVTMETDTHCQSNTEENISSSC